MAQRLDWPRYSRWTWIIALLAVLALLGLWLSGRGPSTSGACCGGSTAVAPVALPANNPAAAAPARVAHKTTWEGNKVTLEGSLPDAASKKALLEATGAKYGPSNVTDKLTLDAAAQGAINLTLQGAVASEAVKGLRVEEARALYVGANINNQLTVPAASTLTAAAPAARAQDVQCSEKIALAVNFPNGSSKMNDETRTLLDAVVPCIKGAYEVGGHTDSVGEPSRNLALSQRRASRSADYLVSRGVDAKLLIPKGYGDSTPIANNATEEGKAKNRRIEFKKQ